MLFRDLADGAWLAVSQPAHALVSGQILRAWGAPGFALPDPAEDVAVAAAQHDLAWLEWESAPTLDPATGRPHVFWAVGATRHAPMWSEAVRRALTAWGPWVALLVSRHGSLIYGRYADRHRMSESDAAAADAYVRDHAALQRDLSAALGATPAQVDRNAALVAVADALSLAVCGGITFGEDHRAGEAPLAEGGTLPLRLASAGEGVSALSPWPFAAAALDLTCPVRRLPAGARWSDEAAMRAALDAAPWEALGARLVPG
jgi:hypothetical protein